MCTGPFIDQNFSSLSLPWPFYYLFVLLTHSHLGLNKYNIDDIF